MEKEAALPKNIRQIGEISGRERICIEDYVMTYIRKREPQEDNGYLGILFGEQQETEDSTYVFIRGIFELPEEFQEPQEQEKLKQEYERYFENWTVQGCCVIGAYPTERMKRLGAWLPESGKLIYHLQEQEETLYWTGEEEYRRLRGYFVFYEQNRKMQEYLAEIFKDNSVEKESLPDRAIRSFREKVKEKGEQKHMNVLRMASSFFVIAILIVGAIVVNRVEDIRMVHSLSTTDGGTALYQSQENETVPKEAVSRIVSQRSDQGAAEQTTQGSSAQKATQGSTGQETAQEKESIMQEVTQGNAAQGIVQEKESTAQEVTQGNGTQETVQGSAVQNTAEQSSDSAETTVQYGAAAGTAQYNAVQKAAEEARLSGSDAFWEESDLEDATEQPSEEKAETAADAANLADTATSAASEPKSETQKSEAAESEAAQEAAAVRTMQAGYVIKEGDTLAKICSRYYGTIDRIEEVCEANGIEDANVIMPGQRIVLP